MAGVAEKFVYQGVHMQFRGEFSEAWAPGEVRHSRLIFIGKHLDRERLVAGFNACRDVHQYISEAEIASTKLRFALGDTVEVQTAPATYSRGAVCAVFHREPHFPPNLFVPYQVQLESGSAVYVPADTEDFCRAAPADAPAP